MINELNVNIRELANHIWKNNIPDYGYDRKTNEDIELRGLNIDLLGDEKADSEVC